MSSGMDRWIGIGGSAKREAAGSRRDVMKELPQWRPCTLPSMQQVRGVVHQGGG